MTELSFPPAWTVTPAVETNEVYIPAMVRIPVRVVKCTTCREQGQRVMDAAHTLLSREGLVPDPAMREALWEIAETPTPPTHRATCAGQRHGWTFVAGDGTRGTVSADLEYACYGDRSADSGTITVPVDTVRLEPADAS